jgi:hypothetical protein
MAAVMFLMSMPIGIANAGLISTEQVIERESATEDRARVLEFMARQDVQTQLTEFGVDPAMAQARVNSLSDSEIQKIAGRIDELPAGQDALSAILGTALLIFIVLLITDILGLTDVFPFVRR